MIDLKQIRLLSIEERILMVQAIWDSIAEDSGAAATLTHEQEEELMRRIEVHESGNGITYTWEEAKSKLKIE